MIRGRRSCPPEWGLTAYTYMTAPGSFWEPGIFYQNWWALSNKITKNLRNGDGFITNGELTMGSLFDGIGGFPLAAVRNGIRPVWASEIEAFPMEVTKLRFPNMIHVGDITKLDGAKLPPVDIICGGSPCQDCLWPGRALA